MLHLKNMPGVVVLHCLDGFSASKFRGTVHVRGRSSTIFKSYYIAHRIQERSPAPNLLESVQITGFCFALFITQIVL